MPRWTRKDAALDELFNQSITLYVVLVVLLTVRQTKYVTKLSFCNMRLRFYRRFHCLVEQRKVQFWIFFSQSITLCGCSLTNRLTIQISKLSCCNMCLQVFWWERKYQVGQGRTKLWMKYSIFQLHCMFVPVVLLTVRQTKKVTKLSCCNIVWV